VCKAGNHIFHYHPLKQHAVPPYECVNCGHRAYIEDVLADEKVRDERKQA
jgi:Zn ribbon nucleic-acid-binding protein